MLCLNAVPQHWHRPRPCCFPTGSSQAEVQRPRPALLMAASGTAISICKTDSPSSCSNVPMCKTGTKKSRSPFPDKRWLCWKGGDNRNCVSCSAASPRLLSCIDFGIRVPTVTLGTNCFTAMSQSLAQAGLHILNVAQGPEKNLLAFCCLRCQALNYITRD